MDSSEHDSSVTSAGLSRREISAPGEEDAEELQLELTKVEDEIQTLRRVLTLKERQATELKRRLAISPLSEIQQNISRGWHDIQLSSVYLTASATLEDISHSEVYKRTRETLSQAGHMTSAVFSTVGSAIRTRLGEMRSSAVSPCGSLGMPAVRNSPSFKSFEDKLEYLKHQIMDQSNNEASHSSSSNSAAF